MTASMDKTVSNKFIPLRENHARERVDESEKFSLVARDFAPEEARGKDTPIVRSGSFMFTNGRTKLMSINQVVNGISRFIKSEPSGLYRIVIGTDSQSKGMNGDSYVNFVSAIVIHRVGNGAVYYWRRERAQGKFVIRDKIYRETLMSLELAQELVPLLRKNISSAKYDFEIHIDVGPVGQTREMIKEVVGMVSGNGFRAKTKPESWGASTVADKHT